MTENTELTPKEMKQLTLETYDKHSELFDKFNNQREFNRKLNKASGKETFSERLKCEFKEKNKKQLKVSEWVNLYYKLGTNILCITEGKSRLDLVAKHL